jgi:hypothetical protein
VKAAKRKAKPASNAKANASNTNAKTEGFDVFRFEGLPGEIRNHIYGFALIVDGPIHISWRANQEASKQKEREHQEVWGVSPPRGNRSVHKFSAIVKKAKGKAVRNFNYRDVAGLSLLRTNKHISTEARPLLYARNTFRFESRKSFHAFYECAHKTIAFLEDIEFVELPDRHVVAGPLAHAKRLSRVFVTTKSIIRTDSPYGIANLVLKCRCKVCTAHRLSPDLWQSPGLAKPGEGCIAATDEMQRSRLATISVRVNNFEIRLTDDSEGANVGSTNSAKQMKHRLFRQLTPFITTNVRIANGKRP